MYLHQKAIKRLGKPQLSWPESAEEYLKNWKRKAQDRAQWRAVVEEAKVHQGLLCHKEEEEEEEKEEEDQKLKKKETANWTQPYRVKLHL
jgi:sirohydrochlorin ferrochelatase